MPSYLLYTMVFVMVGTVLYGCIEWAKDLAHIVRYRRDNYDTRLAIELALVIAIAAMASAHALAITIRSIINA
jgi:hypothetical protein